MKKTIITIVLLLASLTASAQINTDRVIMIGRNALAFEDYVLSIHYFNQVILARPHLAQPFYYRAVAKFMLGDFQGAEEDATEALYRNPFLLAAYQLRGAARQNMGLFELAAADYMRSLEFFPEDRLTLTNMAIVSFELGYLDETKQFLELLLRRYANNTTAFLIRSQVHLEQNDTISALEDLSRAIEIDPFFALSFSMRAGIHIQQQNFENALADLSEAIRLNPFSVDNFINRGMVHFHLNDLRGAMADYDRVIELDRNNLIGRFNRGLLRAQVADNNRAIEDFDHVIALAPRDMSAFINRAMLHYETGNLMASLDDLNVVLERHPDFFSGLYMRSELRRQMGDLRGAEEDFRAARRYESIARVMASENPEPFVRPDDERDTRQQSDEDIERFNRLVVADRAPSDNRNVGTHQRQSRGMVQFQDVDANPEPRFVLTYYVQPLEVPRPVYFSTLIDDANRELGLSWMLRATNQIARLNEMQVHAHFRSINNYFHRLDAEPNNPLLYFGRAMDFMLVQDFENAMNDINRAIELRADFAVAYFIRALIRIKQLDLLPTATQNPFLSDQNTLVANNDMLPGIAPRLPEISTRSLEFDAIMRDYERVIALRPEFIFAHFNMAELFRLNHDFHAAIDAYTRAIELEPRFAEAFFNRGLMRLSIGETVDGINDLRQAGELGIVQAYAIIVRMQR